MTKDKTGRPVGLGIGYVSIMIIFAVIGLTILAVLSFQAAGSDKGLTEKNARFTSEYYAADSRAKQILAELDGAAAGELFFEESFSEAAAEVCPEAKTSITAEGVRVDYSVEINQRQTLFVGVTFFRNPGEGERFRVDRWQNGTYAADEDESHLNIWDGHF